MSASHPARTVRSLLTEASSRLDGSAARFESEALLAHALGISRAGLFARPEFEPDALQCATYMRLIEARSAGEPFAHLVGHREFWSLDLVITPDVLIPRPETELLVELALARLPNDRAVAIADLGTGSGAIALALACERPRARVLATDASEAALAVARRNARRLGVWNVEFAHGDWCVALGTERFELIVSNPPYIETDDAHLRQGDLRYEPRDALASGIDGLDAIRAIVTTSPQHLFGGAWLVLEHGWNQAERVRDLLTARGFAGVKTYADAAGHERATLARFDGDASV